MTTGITIQERGPFASVGTSAIAGTCICSDQRGTSEWVYHFQPAADGLTAEFSRVSTSTGARQILAAPGVLGGNARFGQATAILPDSSGPTPFLAAVTADVWLVHGCAIAPWLQIQHYNADTNAWALASQAGGGFDAGGLGNATLNAQWNASISMAHPCTTVGPAASDDFLYIGGPNTANVGGLTIYIYRYEISTGTVVTLANRAGATGAGYALAWLSRYPDRIYSTRGAAAPGSALIDYFSIANNNWTAVAYFPNTETFSAGVSMTTIERFNAFVLYQGGRILALVPDGPTMGPVGTIYGADGTPHVGQKIAVRRVESVVYLYPLPSGAAQLQRLRVVEPA